MCAEGSNRTEIRFRLRRIVGSIPTPGTTVLRAPFAAHTVNLAAYSLVRTRRPLIYSL